MLIQLKQVGEPGEEDTVLAKYDESARTFLFPKARLSSPYPDEDREVLLDRCGDFPVSSNIISFFYTCALISKNSFLEN